MGSPYHECLGKAAPLVWIDHDQLLKTANRQVPLRACFIRHKPSLNSNFTYPSVLPSKEDKGQVSRDNQQNSRKTNRNTQGLSESLTCVVVMLV